MVRSTVMSLFGKLVALPGLEELLLTTNGVQLDKYAKPLRAAGVNRINIGIDSIGADRFKRISRVGKFDKVLQGIDGAFEAGFEQIKLYSEIMNGYNEDEVIALADYAVERDIDIAFLKEMPLGIVSEHDRQETT
jgi:cyclic pyranopterin phosphate synthase